ncbi:SPOSA6832_02839 [Sporobolomyces salmonicolor]|uniref:SPOSA6832_02839-mRNA-1:cds n=1 Tax=Sporidiobolus salmonicolor TaxID=5005 RepID=A0A0D6EMI9_SPOSA|nr:SPOSA6832_02839 [Sporobolomyces salmonicolor]
MATKIRHEWYQTDSEVVVSVFIRNVKEEDLKVDIQERSVSSLSPACRHASLPRHELTSLLVVPQLSLSVRLPTGSDIVFDLDPVAHPIDVAQSSYRVLQPKIELKLRKKDAGIKWTKVEGEDEPVGQKLSAPAESAAAGAHAYPSSSRKHHNWDAIARDAAAEDEAFEKEFSTKNPGAGGDKQLNELFQKLYADATDDQRRAMVKSYQESNGTALSTDWSDVKSSMVAKKWGA